MFKSAPRANAMTAPRAPEVQSTPGARRVAVREGEFRDVFFNFLQILRKFYKDPVGRNTFLGSKNVSVLLAIPYAFSRLLAIKMSQPK